MKVENIDISKLKLVKNYAISKGVSRQRIYELLKDERFDTITIDGMTFIILNEKAAKYRK